jgi:hypothetical protein
MDALIIGTELQLAAGARQCKSVEFRTIGEQNVLPDWHSAAGTSALLDSSQKGDQRARLLIGEFFEGGHSFARNAFADDLADLLIVFGSQAG